MRARGDHIECQPAEQHGQSWNQFGGAAAVNQVRAAKAQGLRWQSHTGLTNIQLSQRLDDWLIKLERQIDYVCKYSSVEPSDEQLCDTAILHLDGEAGRIASDVITEQAAIEAQGGNPCDHLWQLIRAALKERFGVPQDGLHLLDLLDEVQQQSSQSVRKYTEDFESALRDLEQRDLISRDVAVQKYIHGLKPHLGKWVKQEIQSKPNFFVDIAPREIKKAIRNSHGYGRGQGECHGGQRRQTSRSQPTLVTNTS